MSIGDILLNAFQSFYDANKVAFAVILGAIAFAFVGVAFLMDDERESGTKNKKKIILVVLGIIFIIFAIPIARGIASSVG